MTLYDDTLSLLQELIRNACVNDLTPDSGHEVRNADSLENSSQVKTCRLSASSPTRAVFPS